MPKITALIHTHNDAARLGRVLESLRACDEILVVDHGSKDNTERIAQEYGATLKRAIPGVDDGAYAFDAKNDWVFCVLPSEAVSEALEAALFEWKQSEAGETVGFSIRIREESGRTWKELAPELRLVDRTKLNWVDRPPPSNPKTRPLRGHLLRFKSP